MHRSRRTFLKSVGLGAAGLVALPRSCRSASAAGVAPTVIERNAGDTLTAVELNHGDTLRFTLRNGEIRTLELKATSADVVITNLPELKKAHPNGGTLYRFACEVLVDGQEMTMERYVCSQESFYEPYVVNGMRIWFDGVTDIFDLITEEHGECKPRKHARLAVSDATDRICPETVYSWYPNGENYISIGDSYNGDDPWMGPYQGADAHGGLDVNQPNGRPNFTPVSIDDHFLFNSLKAGDNNNRWRGFKTWDNGDVWTLQDHHILQLLVPEHEPITSGAHFAEAAGVHVGSENHSHYVFKIESPENSEQVLLDPWIIFWQAFEDDKARSGSIRAQMAPLSPGRTGEPVRFGAGSSRSGDGRTGLQHYWTFGDGGWSREAEPQHTFVRPGVYPVTLIVDDGAVRATRTQHITVDGPSIDRPAPALASPDEPSFRRRAPREMDVYGAPIRQLPHSLHFLARASRPVPRDKEILIQNIGAGTLPEVRDPEVEYGRGDGWLTCVRSGAGNDQKLVVGVDATGLPEGRYSALVHVDCPGAVNGSQGFRVELVVPTYPPTYGLRGDVVEIVDDADDAHAGFYHTPYFWVGHRFKKWEEKGYSGFYLTNGGRAVEGEFARFTPDLEAGTYEVSLLDETPYEPERRMIETSDGTSYNEAVPSLQEEVRFRVRVRSKAGDEILTMEPARSRVIGTFRFDEGRDGFVEILAGGSTGQVLVDAVRFRRVDASDS